MYSKSKKISIQLLAFVLLAIGSRCSTLGQQTLGGITGTVTDASGGAVPGTAVTAIEDSTQLTRTATTNDTGAYAFVNLPIGTYTLTYAHDGFQTENHPGIVVQADRTVTLNASLKVGDAKAESIEVQGTPLMNATDTTNGYILDKGQIDSIPLANGTPLALATLSPGVSAELSGGTGVNSGLGNPPIWANGQRDTSNSFALNGVDGSTLFNGKSTSQVGSARVVNSTGVGQSGAGGVIQSSASVYLSIGNSIPTPAAESIEEVRVNTSMYDAQQGGTSGAHIDLSTSSGTNSFHGQLYGHRGTNWINAAPFFFKTDGAIPDNKKNPELHRYIAGGTFGGPIIKNKLFGFVAYQHLHVADQEIGDSALNVPVGLSDTTRDAGDFAGLVNIQYGTALTGANIDPTVLAFLNSPALPGEPGKWLIPNDITSNSLSATHSYDSFLPGTGRFTADQAVGNLDYDWTAKDTVALKYYYQHDPTVAPYAYSSVPGFDEHLDAGAQVISINNTYLVKPNLSTTQTFGFLREKIYATNAQPFTPQSIPGGSAASGAINTFGSSYFPGISIVNVLGDKAYSSGVSTGTLNIGPNAEAQGSNTGVFQNRWQPSGNAIWSLGKHTLSFGANYSYTQLNTIDKRTGTGTIAADDLSQFAQGYVTPGGSSTGFYVSSFLQGNASRYYRANQLGLYLQDKFQVTPNLSLTAGVRYDWDGGLTEKEGRIFNFDPSLYSYSAASDTINNPGFIIAGNNANGTAGVSPTTLTGRQWGIGPRLGVAWQPDELHNKVVVRSGFGMYFDRGELFSYFSPGYAIGTVTGGPFGVNQQLPFVTAQTCPTSTLTYYEGYIPTCGGGAVAGNLENPYGSVLSPAPNNPKSSDLRNYLPNLASINAGGQPISLGVYDRANKLPYTFNYTLDIQWQPRNDIAVDISYVGNVGRHQVIPVPFNQPNIATPAAPINGQNYSYGYTVGGVNLPDGTPYLYDFEGGNVDHRVPYIGYAAESIDYKAAGIDAYNALQAHVEKRMSHGIQFGASYTYSHATDEQSGLGLFYNGNNPLNLQDAYGSSDFDRTHVINFNYVFTVPDFAPKHSVEGYLINGWQLVGLTVLQSGQPYSVIDFTGAVGSIYYSTNNGITNPIVPLAAGCTAKTAKTGHSGAFPNNNPADYNGAALKDECFTVPLLGAGSFAGGIPSNDPYETGFTSGQRNIFRQPFQKRADASLVKQTKIKEGYDLKYTFDVFNLTNTTSFDVPGNEVSQNQNYNSFPAALNSGPTTPTQVLPTNSCSSGNNNGNTGFYNCPFGLGVVTHTVGAQRQIQMSLRLSF
jgi:hypothetical protein